ncbi:TonB-dependent receptor plug domain-containing protein [Paracoccus sp. DMF-8]|uniref:TonB-dependent receptor plug domain-containing protein n=1 Tax=Paracoccus sp. DMF-8 TaxID=3019445 RepID=UPI0023E3DE45|nr:TonB-dependent receptor plug domain-containing protein [Paracoccus sp. DMF-8]MDF3607200.1 TonB-dependent receptor plug domain-containing protein [Paracoccus sp. DMF-8]
MTHQTLQDQNLTTMSEAMIKAPGVVATINGGGNPVYSARGFDIGTYQIDGLGTNYDWTWRPDFDLSIYDRVEVLRGAEGLFSGAGEPGGTVNLARKRPTDEFSLDLTGLWQLEQPPRRGRYRRSDHVGRAAARADDRGLGVTATISIRRQTRKSRSFTGFWNMI